VEGEYVQVAAPRGGQLDRLLIARGALVAAGAPLFALDAREEAAAVAETREQLAQAERRLADLGKGGRSSELAALGAALDQARSARELARQEWTRRRELQREGLVTAEELERVKSVYERAEALAAQREAELATARLGARADQQQAASAEVGAARARLERAQWALAQKSQAAPAAGLVFDTLFEAGEYVPAGRPVVTLLPPANVKIRFFVPEPALGALRVGQQVEARIDGAGTLVAIIDYLSPRAEYTPPVIYSRETRAKLVFLAEARPAPAEASRLHPGQPVEVRLMGAP
jgi:HlyD family secretion protein